MIWLMSVLRLILLSRTRLVLTCVCTIARLLKHKIHVFNYFFTWRRYSQTDLPGTWCWVNKLQPFEFFPRSISKSYSHVKSVAARLVLLTSMRLLRGQVRPRCHRFFEVLSFECIYRRVAVSACACMRLEAIMRLDPPKHPWSDGMHREARMRLDSSKQAELKHHHFNIMNILALTTWHVQFFYPIFHIAFRWERSQMHLYPCLNVLYIGHDLC